MFLGLTPYRSASLFALSGCPLTNATTRDFSHLANAGKISLIARYPRPTTAQPVFFPGASGTFSCGDTEAVPAVGDVLSDATALSLASAPARFAAAIPPPTSVRNFRLDHLPTSDFGFASTGTPPQMISSRIGLHSSDLSIPQEKRKPSI